MRQTILDIQNTPRQIKFNLPRRRIFIHRLFVGIARNGVKYNVSVNGHVMSVKRVTPYIIRYLFSPKSLPY